MISWWVPNPPFANPRVAEKARWQSLQSGVAGVYSLLEIPADSYRFLSHLTPSSDPNHHLARKALSATPGLAPGGLDTRQISAEMQSFKAFLLVSHKDPNCRIIPEGLSYIISCDIYIYTHIYTHTYPLTAEIVL